MLFLNFCIIFLHIDNLLFHLLWCTQIQGWRNRFDIYLWFGVDDWSWRGKNFNILCFLEWIEARFWSPAHRLPCNWAFAWLSFAEGWFHHSRRGGWKLNVLFGWFHSIEVIEKSSSEIWLGCRTAPSASYTLIVLASIIDGSGGGTIPHWWRFIGFP